MNKIKKTASQTLKDEIEEDKLFTDFQKGFFIGGWLVSIIWLFITLAGGFWST